MLVVHPCDFILWCPGASALRRLRMGLEKRNDVFVCLESAKGKVKTARAGTKARESTSDRSGVPPPAFVKRYDILLRTYDSFPCSSPLCITNTYLVSVLLFFTVNELRHHHNQSTLCANTSACN